MNKIKIEFRKVLKLAMPGICEPQCRGSPIPDICKWLFFKMKRIYKNNGD